MLQYWYDNPESLIWKYKYAKSMGLRGLGPFQFGDEWYDGTDSERKELKNYGLHLMHSM